MRFQKTEQFSNVFAALTLVAAGTLAGGTALAAGKNDAAATRAEIEKQVGFVPAHLKAIPEIALPGYWSELAGLEANPNTAIPCRYKELIGVAVAAQVPCKACVTGHAKLARASGATPAEVSESATMAGLTRHWSTFFNGVQLDEGKFRAEIKQATDGIKKAMASNTPPPAPLEVADAKSALADVQQSFGFVPEFLKKFPPAALPGAWRQMREVEMASETAIPDKYKSLISLAVASQIPCRYCVIADTEFAKLGGATDQEIAEAVAMAALLRDESTLVTGLDVHEGTYVRDMDRIAKGIAQYNAKHASAPGAKSASATASR